VLDTNSVHRADISTGFAIISEQSGSDYAYLLSTNSTLACKN